MNAVDTAEVEAFLLIDADGGYVITHDESNLADLYDNEIGSDAGVTRRVIKLKLTVPLPRPIEAAAAIPETDGPVNVMITQ